MNTQDLIINYLKQGKEQHEISQLLKDADIRPNSLSHVEKALKLIKERYGAKTMFHLGFILATFIDWISVEQSLPKNHSIVEAKNENTGHIGKQIVFTDGVFNHEFTSQSSEASMLIEFKNVTHWKYENKL